MNRQGLFIVTFGSTALWAAIAWGVVALMRGHAEPRSLAARSGGEAALPGAPVRGALAPNRRAARLARVEPDRRHAPDLENARASGWSLERRP